MVWMENGELCLILIQFKKIAAHPFPYFHYTGFYCGRCQGPVVSWFNDDIALCVVSIDVMLQFFQQAWCTCCVFRPSTEPGRTPNFMIVSTDVCRIDVLIDRETTLASWSRSVGCFCQTQLVSKMMSASSNLLFTAVNPVMISDWTFRSALSVEMVCALCGLISVMEIIFSQMSV